MPGFAAPDEEVGLHPSEMNSQPASLSLESARELLRSKDLRCTSCRIAVLQHLTDARYPLSHAEVAEQLVPRGYDKSTIYRCLMELADCGLLLRLDLGDHVWRFERQDEAARDEEVHPHFLCTTCGKVKCLDDVDLQIQPTAGDALTLDVTEVLLKGRCGDCR